MPKSDVIVTFSKEIHTMDHQLRKVCNAAERNDAAQVRKHLQCQRIVAGGLEANLLASTPAALELENLLVSDRGLVDCSAEHAYLAMLLVPPCYEMPWKAILLMLSALRNRKGWLGNVASTGVCSMVGSAQMFLQQAFSLWWRQEHDSGTPASHMKEQRKKQGSPSPKSLLLQIVHDAMSPLVDGLTNFGVNNDSRVWMVPFELITTIVSLSSELERASVEGESFTSLVLDGVFHEEIRKDRILQWMSLASDLRKYLRPQDETVVRKTVEASLVKNAIAMSDLPGVAKWIVSFSTSQNQTPEWDRVKQLLVLVLHSASRDVQTYSTVELVLLSSLNSLSKPDLQAFLTSLSLRLDYIPPWVQANAVLLLFQAARESGSQLVSAVLSHSLGGNENSRDLELRCWSLLVRLLLPQAEVSSPPKKQSDIEQEIVQRIVGGLIYTSGGVFVHGNQPSKLDTSLICKSLFLGSSSSSSSSCRTHRLYAAERGQRWVHAANAILHRRRTTRTPSSQEFLVGVATLVTIFFEVKESRSTIMNRMVQTLLGDAESAPSCFACITIIAKSVKEERTFDELTPLTALLPEMSEFRTFKILTDALAPCESARGVILSTARKILNSCLGKKVWWGFCDETRGVKKIQEQLRCVLYVLCILLVCQQESWDQSATDSWVLLTDILVLDRPTIPLQLRSWLYKQLTDKVHEPRFPGFVADHILRAAVFRLLAFFDLNGDRCLRFSPRSEFVTWQVAGGSKDKMSHRDDLVGLVLLSLGALKKICATNGACLRDVGDRFTQLLYSKAQQWTLDLDSKKPLQSLASILFACFGALLSTVRPQQLDVTVPIHTIETLRGMLFEMERTAVPHSGIDWTVAAAQKETGGEYDGQPFEAGCACDACAEIVLSAAFFLPRDRKLQKRTATLLVELRESGRKRKLHDSLGFLHVAPTRRRDLTQELRLLSDELAVSMGNGGEGEVSEGVFHAIEHVSEELTAANCQLMAIPNEAGTCWAEEVLKGLSTVYEKIASEKATVRLVSCLENSCSTDGKRLTEKFPDPEVATRHFRTLALKAICLSCRRCLVDKRFMLEVSAPTTGFLPREARRRSELALLVFQFTQTLASDLRLGLDGSSCGITDYIYGIYLDLLEAFMSPIEMFLQSSIDVNIQSQISACCKAVSSTLCDLLCTYAIKVAPLFRRTLRMAIHVLPSMSRGLAFRRLESDFIGADFERALFQQLVEISDRLNKPSSGDGSWYSVVGPQHMLEDDDLGEEARANETAETTLHHDGGIPCVVQVDSSSFLEKETSKVVQLPSRETWTWALVVGLSAMEKHWSDVQVWLPETQTAMSTPGSETRATFCRHLRDALSGTIEACSLALKSQSGDMAAVLFPPRVKLRLVMVIERMVAAVQRSVRLLTVHLRKHDAEKLAFMSPALAVLLAWIGVDGSRSGITSGIFDWCRAEGEQNLSGNSRRHSIYPRLSRAAHRTEDLGKSLRQLCSMVASDRGGKDGCVIIERVLNQVVGRDQNDKGSTPTFYVLLGRHLKATSSSILEFRGKDALRAKRRMPSNVKYRKKRKGMTRRSRNQTIDKWLQLDDEQADEEPIDNDAYAELEDFLVDG